ncbi:MAG: HlyD family efflux transporter periplasmic adaptor subunit [Bacteroidota bacterium]
MNKLTISFISVLSFLLLTNCSEQNAIKKDESPIVTVKSIQIQSGDIENYITLNGKTLYLKKHTIVSPISGFIVKLSIKFGDKVKKNDLLFEIQTKENKALGNTNPLSGNIGIVKVLASSDGYINELMMNETGGFVSESAILCTIIDENSLMLQVNVPFEYNALVHKGTKCRISLTDNTQFDANVSQILPLVKEAEQTQAVLIKPTTNIQLPENLTITVKFVNTKHSTSLLIPKTVLMCNETQTEFWVMKVLNMNMAVKIPVLKGIENDSMVEIISSDVNKNNWVISEGAYGLSDSTVVKIVK